MDRETEELLDNGAREEVVVPLLEEEVTAGAKAVKTGSVRIEKYVERRVRRLEMPLLQEEVEVRRVPMNRVVAEIPKVRRKGDVVIVPVVHEELVITRRLVLKEEIHLVKKRTRERVVKEVGIDRERAEVHRLDAAGRELPTRRRRIPG